MTWDLKADRPIYTQLMEEIELRIVSGLYPPGSKLPSVRDMAAEAAVNPNTMQKALSELEREQLVYSQRTIGRFITQDIALIEKMKSNLAVEKTKEFFEKMNGFGYSTNETMAMVEKMAKEME